jgi:phosphomannomutase
VPLAQATRRGLVQVADFLPDYLRGLRAFVDLAAIRRLNARVVVDSMHGTGGRFIEQLVGRGRCRIETVRAEPDARFGGHAPEPIPANLGNLQQAVRRARAHAGLANDGDADRLGLVGPGGRWINPGQVMCLLLDHLVRQRGGRGAIVKTVSNTMMLNRMAQGLGLELMISSVNVIFVYYAGIFSDAQALAAVLLILAVAASEAVVGLSLILRVRESGRAADSSLLQELRG